MNEMEIFEKRKCQVFNKIQKKIVKLNYFVLTL